MSKYLGFKPTDNPNYYFLSYNSEDSDRISELAGSMQNSGIELWYDDGIEYGEKWEETLTRKIRNSQAMILVFTKGILNKENSYVQREFKIASHLNKKVYVILYDKIDSAAVPDDKLSWWKIGRAHV